MKKKITIEKNYPIYALIVTLLLYLIIGTGLHGDDFGFIKTPLNGIGDFINPDPLKKGVVILFLPSYYTFFWAYNILGFEHQWIYDLIKCIAHMISIFFVYKFACDYLPADRAIIASILFVLYPLHDTTIYWYMTVPYVLVPAVIMYSHLLIRKEKNGLGLLLLTLGAFATYGSPPYVFGLAAIFFFEKKYIKTLLFAIPGLLYVAFYFFITNNVTGIVKKIDNHLSIIAFNKQFILQLLSFIEAAFGPSYWLKCFYSIGSIGLLSAVIAIGVVILLFIKLPSFSERPTTPKSFYIGLIFVMIFSCGIYALTGLYPQSAFNLGNRSTVSGSLLIAFLLALLPINKKIIVFFAFIFILPLFGLSDHWKSWNTHQKTIIHNIIVNNDLKQIGPGSTIMVTENMYSHLGPFSHIDFLSSPTVIKPIFFDLKRKNDIFALTSDIYMKNGFLIDRKYGGIHELNKKIYLYNSETNSVNEIILDTVPQLLAQRHREIRHWVQLTKGSWIESCLVYLNPMYSRLFKN